MKADLSRRKEEPSTEKACSQRKSNVIRIIMLGPLIKTIKVDEKLFFREQ